MGYCPFYSLRGKKPPDVKKIYKFGLYRYIFTNGGGWTFLPYIYISLAAKELVCLDTLLVKWMSVTSLHAVLRYLKKGSRCVTLCLHLLFFSFLKYT